MKMCAVIAGMFAVFTSLAADINITNVTRADVIPSSSYALGTTGLVTRLLPINLMSVSHATSADSATTATNVFPSTNWSFVHIPDWQIATSNQWNTSVQTIITNATRWNLQMALFTGDMLADGGVIASWRTVTQSIYQIASAGIPCLVMPGAHDADVLTGERYYTNFNFYFGTTFYQSFGWWKGGMEDTNNPNCGVYMSYTNSPSEKWLFIGLQYAPDPTNWTWASNIMSQFSDHSAVLFTHAFLTRNGQIYSKYDAYAPNTTGAMEPADAWATNLSYIPNLQMIVSGHDIGGPASASMTAEARDGHAVSMLFLNAQQAGAGYDTVARVFNVDENKPSVTATSWNCYYGTNYVDGQLNQAFNPNRTVQFPFIAENEIAVNGSAGYAPIPGHGILYGPHFALRQLDSNQLPTNSWTIGYNTNGATLEFRNGSSPSSSYSLNVASNTVVASISPGGVVDSASTKTNAFSQTPAVPGSYFLSTNANCSITGLSGTSTTATYTMVLTITNTGNSDFTFSVPASIMTPDGLRTWTVTNYTTTPGRLVFTAQTYGTQATNGVARWLY